MEGGHREPIDVLVNVDISGVDALVKRMTTSLDAINAVRNVLKKHGRIMQARAVHNVSGNYVFFEGKTWVINRQTGKLARGIQVADAGPLGTAVRSSAEYSSDVELGTRGPVDLKKTKLAGKIVPLPVSNKAAQKARNFYQALGAKLSTKYDSHGRPILTAGGYRTQAKYATTGKFMGNASVVFRRVPGPGGKGWIIPKREGRPFLREALEYTKPLLQDAIEQAFAKYLEGGYDS
jgi:hypothetical protein